MAPRILPANLRARLKPALAVLAVLAALGLVLPPAATRLIGQEALKSRVEAELTRALGRTATLEGPVRLGFLPWPGLSTGPVSVADAPGFGDAPFLRVERLEIGFDLGALARGSLTMDGLALEAPVLRLTRLEDGRENWRELFGQQSAGPGLPPQGLRIGDARVEYADKATGRALSLSRLNLRTGRGRHFDFSLSCEAVSARPDLETSLTVMGKALMDDQNAQIFLDKVRLAGSFGVRSVQPALERAGNEPLRAVFSALLTLNTQAKALELADIQVNGADAHLEGVVNVANLDRDLPTLVSTLSLRGRPDGQWTRLLGVSLPRAEERRTGDGPALRAQPSGEQEPFARLDFSWGAPGWRIENLRAGDGQGQLTGQAGFVEGELTFDLKARGFDTSRWRATGASGGLWPLLAALRPVKSASGRLAGQDLRLGQVALEEAYAALEGQEGEFRAYPLSARSPYALLTGEGRLRLKDSGAEFTLGAQLASLVAGEAEKPPLVAAQAQTQGEITPEGVTARLQAKIGDPLQSWRAPGLPEEWDRLWRGVGAITLRGALVAGSGSDRSAADWDSWELSDLDLKSSSGHVFGRLAGRGGRLEADLGADRLELDRLLALAELGAGEGGDIPWPVEGRVAVKKLVVKGLDVDDLTLAGQVGPRTLKLTTATASLAGGKVSASCDADIREGRESLSAQAALSGVQAQALSAFLPAGVKLSGTVEGKLNAEASGRAGQPLWRGLRAQADLSVASGHATFSGEGGRAPSAWAVSRATLSLKATLRPAGSQAQGPEAVLADLTGQIGADALGSLKRLRLDIHGQAGLDQSAKPLWFRQPKLEAALALGPPLTHAQTTSPCQVLGRFEADLEKGSFSLADAELRLPGATGKGRIAGVPGPGGGMTLSGVVDFPGFNPRDVLPQLGFSIPSRAGSDTWRRAGLSAEIGGNARELRLGNVRAFLDATQATGAASLADGRARLDLNVDVLDLDRLDPPAAHGADAHGAAKAEEPYPLETLRALDLEAKVRIIRLVKDSFTWNDADIALTARGGRFGMRQQSVRFYGGTYYLDFTGDARGPQLACAMELRITGAEAYPFLMDLGGIDTVPRGSVDFSLAVEGHGVTEKGLRRTLSGSSQLKLSDGKLLLRDSSSSASTRQPAQAPRDHQTPPPPPPGAELVSFGRISATFAIRGGVATTRDVVVAGPELVVKGEGQVNLADELIDLSLTAQSQGGGEAPLRIHGPLYDPKLDIDRTKVISDKILGLFKSVLTLPGNIFDRIRRF